MPGRVVVVGLGPAGADHVLPVARRVLERATVRFARTARHPAVAGLLADYDCFQHNFRGHAACGRVSFLHSRFADDRTAPST